MQSCFDLFTKWIVWQMLIATIRITPYTCVSPYTSQGTSIVLFYLGSPRVDIIPALMGLCTSSRTSHSLASSEKGDSNRTHGPTVTQLLVILYLAEVALWLFRLCADIETVNSVCFWNKVGEQTRGTEDWERECFFPVKFHQNFFLMVILISASQLIFEAWVVLRFHNITSSKFLYKQLGSSACWFLLVRLVQGSGSIVPKYPHPTLPLSLSRPDGDSLEMAWVGIDTHFEILRVLWSCSSSILLMAKPSSLISRLHFKPSFFFLVALLTSSLIFFSSVRLPLPST